MPTRYDKEFKQNIINLYKQGESAAQLAREYGIGYSTVHKWIQGQAKTQSGKSPDEIKATGFAVWGERNPKKSPGLPCAEVTNIFDYIHQESHHHQVTKMCRILGVSRAQYYRYRSPKPSKRRAEDADL